MPRFTGAATNIQVHYIEGRAPQHRAELATLLEQLRHLPGCLRADLFSSPQQPALSLLESRWQGTPPALDVPPGCKAWTFVLEASWEATRDSTP